MKKPVFPLFVALFAIGASAVAQLPAQNPIQPPFSITISAPQPMVKPGEDVLLHVTLKNVSNHDIWMGSMFSVECDYRIQVSSNNGLATSDSRCDGSRVAGYMKPGDQKEQDGDLTKISKFDPQGPDLVNVSKTFDFTSPGTYEIQLSRGVPESPTDEIVASNKITITVLPGDVPAHPHPFTIMLTTPHNSIKLGDPVQVHVILKNTSDHEIIVPSSPEPGGLQSHYALAVIGPKVRLFSEGGGNGLNPKTIKPGEQAAEDGTLNSSMDFSAPGQYKIQFFRGDGGDFREWAVKSNIVTITLTE
jgi:hypothetical protein